MVEFFAGIILVAVGFGLGLIPPALARRRRRSSHWNFLKVEIDACGQIAGDLVIEKEVIDEYEGSPKDEKPRTIVLSPLFRLPATSYATAYPALLAEEDLSEDEINALVTFFGHVHEINRGLDYAAEMHKLNEDKKLLRERKRISLKAEKIVRPGEDGQESLFNKCLRIATEQAKMAPVWFTRKQRAT